MTDTQDEPGDPGTTLLSSVLAGVVSGMLAVTFLYSYAAVVMNAADPALTPRLTGHFLIGGAVLATIVGLTSRFRGVVALPQDTPTAVLAVVAVSVVAGSGDAADPEALFATVLALIVVSTLLSGALFWIVGRYRLAILGQYVPYPVVAGFLAATGWLLFKASFGVMSGVVFDLGALSELWEVRELWIPGAAMAVALHLATRRFASAILVPATLLLSTLAYHLVRVAGGISRDEAIADGWLLEPFGSGLLVEPVAVDKIQWSAIGDETFGIATVLIIAIIGVLLNLTALASAFGEDVDVDREMRILGISNVVAAGGGSIVGFHYVSLSTLGRSMGARHRAVGVVVAAVCLLAATIAADALSWIPPFVLGGMVLFIAIGLLHDWLLASVRRLDPPELAIVVVIVVVVEVVGFLEGIAIGLVAASILFVVTYSRAGAIRHVFTGREVHSSIERPTAHRLELSRRDDGIVLVKLQGYIFFASTVGLVESVSERIADESRPVHHLIIDFEHITGIDASGFEGFSKLRRVAAGAGVEIVYSAVSADLRRRFDERATDAGTPAVERFASAEAALEWCEDELLRQVGLDPGVDEFSLDYTLREMFDDARQLDVFVGYLELIELEGGERLDAAALTGNLDFVEVGWLSIHGTTDESARIRRAGPGSVIGLASFFRRGGQVALVSARAETDCTIRRLSSESYFRLVADHPAAAGALQRQALVAISDRYANLLSSYELVMRSRS